ncbi:MAG: sulfide:quinone oxidoreductase [Paracoccaceae bacterium]|jgi:sulfide:quinone oxidoreductase
MDYKSLTRGLSVGSQVTVADLPALKQAGFRAIICNRPDGEEADQPTFEEVSRAAQDLGLETLYLPVVAGRVSDKEAAAFGAALTTLPGPVLAFCRSGLRTTTLWSLSEAKSKPFFSRYSECDKGCGL